MRITMKRLISISSAFLLSILIVSVSQASRAAENSSINVIVKGKHLVMDVNPVLKENKTYIPIRNFAESLDFKVEWIKKQNTVKLSNKETIILIPIGQKYITINDKKISLDEKSFVKNGRTFLPLRSAEKY